MRTMMYNSWLYLYRTMAAIVLYGMLIALAATGLQLGFYSINTQWVAPTLISPANDKILSMSGQLVTSRQALETMTVQTENLGLTRNEQVQRRAALESLETKVTSILDSAQIVDNQTGAQLTVLAEQKKQDAARTKQTVGEIEQLRSSIQRDLKNGFITKSEAMSQEATLAQMKSAITDSEVSAVVLQDSARQKMSPMLSAVDTMSKLVELRAEITQLNALIDTEKQQIDGNQEMIANLKKAIQSTQDNPYFLASGSKVALPFAFVPYDNQATVSDGAKVYDCYLGFVACRQVGTVVRAFSTEEKITNPIYKTDTRGFLIQLNLTHTESVKSRTLFLGHKPLLF